MRRVRREEYLKVPAPKPRKRRRGISTGLPQQAKHLEIMSGHWDFVGDHTVLGGKLRVLNLIDEFTKEGATACTLTVRSRQRTC